MKDGKTGHAIQVRSYIPIISKKVPSYILKVAPGVQILAGPGKGQWRRVVGVSGDRNRTVTLDSPFTPPPTTKSMIQIGQMRGQLLIVGNKFVYGGGLQLYAACCEVTLWRLMDPSVCTM